MGGRPHPAEAALPQRAEARHAPHGMPRLAPVPRFPVGQASSAEGSVPVRAASPYHRALDLGVRASVA